MLYSLSFFSSAAESYFLITPNPMVLTIDTEANGTETIGGGLGEWDGMVVYSLGPGQSG